MTVQQLIDKLKEYPMNMPVTIEDCMDFVEAANDETITVGKYVYSTFPYSDADTFDYVSLEIGDKENW